MSIQADMLNGAYPFDGNHLAGAIGRAATPPTFASIETLPRWAAASVAILTSQTLRMTPIFLPAGKLIYSVQLMSGTQAAVTPTNQIVGLYSCVTPSAPVKLAVSTDKLTTAWAANTLNTFSLTAAYSIPTTGIYLIGIMVKAGTVPDLMGKALPHASMATDTGNADYDASLTTSLPATAALGTEGVNVPWIGVGG